MKPGVTPQAREAGWRAGGLAGWRAVALAPVISEIRSSGITSPFCIAAALSAYESDLFPRSAEAAADSARSLAMLFNADSPKGLVEMFSRFDAEAADDGNRPDAE